jgi:hypothetical protein
MLCEQHVMLTKMGTAVEEGSKEAPAGAFKALTQMYEIADFMSDELHGEEVRGKLEELASSKNLPSWVEADDGKTFFELQVSMFESDGETYGSVSKNMEKCEAAICKAYVGGMLLYIAFLEQSFYIVLEEGDDEQPLLRMEFPDISSRGAVYQIRSYDVDRTGGMTSLVLWQGRPQGGTKKEELTDEERKVREEEEEALDERRQQMEELHGMLNAKKQQLQDELMAAREQKRTLEQELQRAVQELQKSLEDRRVQLEDQLSQAMEHLQEAHASSGTPCPWKLNDGTIDVRGPGYGQTYCVLKNPDGKVTNADGSPVQQKAMFRFGNWCYQGHVTLPQLGPLTVGGKFCDVAVALHSQQGRLAYLCEAKTLPVENPFSLPLAEMLRAITYIEVEVRSAEDTLSRWFEEGTSDGKEVHQWLEEDDGRSSPCFQFTCNGEMNLENIETIIGKVYHNNLVFLGESALAI